MQTGEFCFLTNQYFIDFPDDRLMKNKEIIGGVSHDRPCFFAIQDKLDSRIAWLVPISSKVEKYREHYQRKVEKYGYCSSIRFGILLGAETAFLVQNMCPVIDKYINNVYIDKNRVPIRVDGRLEADIVKNARKTLSDYFRGKPVIFPDVRYIKQQLVKQLESETV